VQNKFCEASVTVGGYSTLELLYFPGHKTHRDFFVRNFRKK